MIELQNATSDKDGTVSQKVFNKFKHFEFIADTYYSLQNVSYVSFCSWAGPEG